MQFYVNNWQILNFSRFRAPNAQNSADMSLEVTISTYYTRCWRKILLNISVEQFHLVLPLHVEYLDRVITRKVSNFSKIILLGFSLLNGWTSKIIFHDSFPYCKRVAVMWTCNHANIYPSWSCTAIVKSFGTLMVGFNMVENVNIRKYS